MSIYKKLSRMNDGRSMEEKLYELLNVEKYRKGQYEAKDLDEGMEVIYQRYFSWSNPRFVLNHHEKRAFEFRSSGGTLLTVDVNDVEWKTLEKVSEDMARPRLGMIYPSYIWNYQNGVAEVGWQLNPDGRFWEEDGFFMTHDVQVFVYGFIDKEGTVVVKFKYIENDKERETMRRKAEGIVANRKGKEAE